MSSSWQFYLPAAGINVVANPSLEVNATGYTLSLGAVIARSNEAAVFGGWSLKVTPDAGQALSGVSVGVSVATSRYYTFSVFIKGAVGQAYSLFWYNVTDATMPASSTFVATGAWQRVEVAYQTLAAPKSYIVGVWRNTPQTAVPFYLDGWQVEIDPLNTLATALATTYMDGDQPGSIWNGARHASTSTRSDQWRGGGRIVDLDTYSAYVTDHQGTGSAGYTNVATDNGIIGGATFQRSIVKPRPFTVTVWFEATSQDDLHTKRQALLDALKPNLVSPQQPLVLRYTGNGNPRIIYCHYDSGLESGLIWPNAADVPIRFVANDPYWYDEMGSAKLLKAYDEVTDADYVIERQTNGTWHALAGGLNGTVRAAVYASDGNLYVGGDFTTAYNAAGTGSPVTVNRVAKWDGTAWTTLGSGFNNTVWTLALDPAGNLYAGGSFTDAAYPYLAKWNGSAWAAVDTAGAGTGVVYVIVYNAVNGLLYIAGNFTNWNANANADSVVAWNGTVYSALSTGISGPVYALAIEANGNVLLGGGFTAVGGVTVWRKVRWNIATAAWEYIDGTGLFNAEVHAIVVDRAGMIFMGGFWTTPSEYPYLAMYNGSSWSAVGAGVNGFVYALRMSTDDQSRMAVAGAFTSAGGLTLRDRAAVWNGSAWEVVPLDLPGSATIWALAHNIYTNELALGYDTSGTAISTNIVDTEVVNPGTEDSAPAIHINHTGILEAITNWTTGKSLFLDLTVQPGETLFLDLSALTPQVLPTLHTTPYGRNGPRLWSTFRGDCTRFILPNSDLASWRLLPGINTILVKTRNADSSATYLLNWRNRFVSLDA